MAKAKAAKPSGGAKKSGGKASAGKAAGSKKKAATTKGAKKSAAPKKKVTRAALSAEQKQRLLKPLTAFPELVERLASTWQEHGRVIRVPGLTAARLSSLLRRAGAASKKEEATRARLEAKLRPLADARLVAEHEVWKAALDVYAMAKAAARTDPGILTPFDFFAEALQKRRSGDAGSEPKEAPAEG